MSEKYRSNARRILLPALIVVTALAAWFGSAAVSRWRETPQLPPPALRVAWMPPDELELGSGPDFPFGLALAPDGRRLAYVAAADGEPSLYLSDLASGSTWLLPGTDGASLPFWSHDARRLGFFAHGRLRVYEVGTGSVSDLADAPSGRGGAWTPEGEAVFAPAPGTGLSIVRSAGAVEPLTSLDAGESSHRFPIVTGDAQLVYFVRASEPTRQGIWISPLASPGQRRRIVGTEAQGIVAGGHLLYASDEALVAQPIATATSGARPALIGLPVGRGPEHQLFATAAGDLVIFGAPGTRLREVQWRDRAGTVTSVAGGPRAAWDVRLSPDERRLAVTEADAQTSTLDVFVYDGARPVPIRMSSSLNADESPAWSPDASRLAWITSRSTLVTRGAQGVLDEQPRLTFDGPARLTQWTRDGRWFVASVLGDGTRDDLWMVPAAGGEAVAYARTPFADVQGTVSPDGRWMVYASDETGQFELYADRFPTPGARTRLTVGGGADPRWTKGGREVVYRRGGVFHALDVAPSGSRLEARSSSRLFDAGADVRAYDVSADGARFLLNVPAAGHAPGAFSVAANWNR